MQTQILSKINIFSTPKVEGGYQKNDFFFIGRRAFLEHIDDRLNPEDEPCTSKIEMAMFVGQGVIKS